jgi:hydroxymethylpyrimidine pyrophosphatase-like HAD family hydrolase
MGRPDLLAIDLDGTLLSADGTVSCANIEAIQRATSEGLPCVIATGRTASECGQILDAIAYDGPLIAASGALLLDVTAGQTLDRHVIPCSHAAVIVTSVLRRGAVPMMLKDRAQTGGIDYVVVGSQPMHPVSDWWFEATSATWIRIDCIEDDPFPDDTVRIGAAGTPEECEPMVSDVQQSLGPAVHARHWEAVTSSAKAGSLVHLLEVFHPDSDKWTMLEKLCKLQGLDSGRTAAVGDGVNDIVLVDRCGLGVAVENADHRVLAVSDATTGSHHDDGVADLIHDLLDGRLLLGGTRL